MSIIKLTATTAAIALTASTSFARDNVQVAGSSTVLPYAAIVAEVFGENFDFPTPVVESGGSSAGLKRFCEGLGANTLDIANASRPIRPAELEVCAAAGVTDIIEVRIGYDGIVFASDINGNSFEFTPADWYKALASEHFIDGALVENTLETWDQVNPDFPAQPIQAFIPGTKHGTREVFEEQVILAGCEEGGSFEAMLAAGVDEDTAEQKCVAIRTDGRSVDIDGDYTETLARIAADERYYMRRWRSLHSDLATASAQAVLDLQRLAKGPETEAFVALAETCAQRFAEGNLAEGTTLLEEMIADMPTGGIDETLLQILHECDRCLGECGHTRVEFILLTLHSLDAALRQVGSPD